MHNNTHNRETSPLETRTKKRREESAPARIEHKNGSRSKNKDKKGGRATLDTKKETVTVEKCEKKRREKM